MRTFSVWFVAVCLLASGCRPAPDALREKTSGDTVAVDVNARAPGFAARTLDGDATVRLADYVGTHVVLLEFWSIFCKSCLEEMPRIEAVYEKYKDRGLVVISVNTDVFSPKRIRKVLDKAGLTPPYPVIRDPRQEVAAAFGVEILPVTVIVDKEGWIRLYQEGYRPGDEDRFEARIRSLLGDARAEDVTLAPRQGMTAFAPRGAALAGVGDRVDLPRVRRLEGGFATLDPARPTLLFFWSLYCQPCRRDFPDLVALARRYEGRGLVTYAVNVDAPRLAPRVARFMADRGGGLPCLVDAPEDGSGLAARLGVRATPTVVLLDRGSQVAFAAAGGGEADVLSTRIDALLASP